jgi:hypothetical protein
MKMIIIDVDNGQVQITTSGFKGTACKKATEQLERDLGTVTGSTPTAEMFQPEQVTPRTVKAGGGR